LVLFVDVDPRTLHLPTMQLNGADPFQTSPAHRTALSSQMESPSVFAAT
jgi:hypothetical protein